MGFFGKLVLLLSAIWGVTGVAVYANVVISNYFRPNPDYNVTPLMFLGPIALFSIPTVFVILVHHLTEKRETKPEKKKQLAKPEHLLESYIATYQKRK
jgi:hypothetical protein